MATPHFKKGQSGNPAGRKPGSKNKLNCKVDEICQREGCNPFEILAQIAAGTLKKTTESEGNGHLITMRLRLEAAAELAQYLAPKLKAVEITGDPENPLNIYMNFGNANRV